MTLGDYERSVRNHLLPEFGPDTPIALITSDQISAFQRRLLSEAACPGRASAS